MINLVCMTGDRIFSLGIGVGALIVGVAVLYLGLIFSLLRFSKFEKFITHYKLWDKFEDFKKEGKKY